MEGLIFFLVMALIASLIVNVVFIQLYRWLRYCALCGCKFVLSSDNWLMVVKRNGYESSLSNAYTYLTTPRPTHRFENNADLETFFTVETKEKLVETLEDNKN